MRADIGAVVVTHRRADLALACVESLRSDLPSSSIAVVVNDPPGSDAGQLEALERLVHVALNERPAGYGANANAGVRALEGRFRHYLVLNDDLEAEPGAVGAMARTLESHAAAGLVGARIVDWHGNHTAAAFRFPSLRSELATAFILPARWQLAVRRRLALAEPARSSEPVDWVLGAALLVRADAFHEVGGFDEAFLMYSEETDLAYRLRRHGWTTHLCREAVMRHVGAASTSGAPYRELLRASRWLFIRRHWPRRRGLALVLLLALAYLWNALYVGARILFSPQSAPEKIRLWLDHWRSRPVGTPYWRQPQ